MQFLYIKQINSGFFDDIPGWIQISRSRSQGQVNFDWAPQSAKDARQEAVSAASETGLISGYTAS